MKPYDNSVLKITRQLYPVLESGLSWLFIYVSHLVDTVTGADFKWSPAFGTNVKRKTVRKGSTTGRQSIPSSINRFFEERKFKVKAISGKPCGRLKELPITFIVDRFFTIV